MPAAKPPKPSAALCLALLVMTTAAAAPAARAAEWNTPYEGEPAITHVKIARNEHLKEYWAWVTIEHEDWPIETRLEPLPANTVVPLRSPYPHEGPGHDASRDHLDLRIRRFTHPYTHFVNWWVVEGPNRERIHRRTIDVPHPSGLPFTLGEQGIKVPLGMTRLTFRAHCKLHGYGKKTVTVDLLQKKGDGYEVGVVPLPPYTGRTGGLRKFMRSQPAIDQLGGSTHW